MSSTSTIRAVIEESGLFDSCFYSTTYAHILNGADPLLHFVEHGHTGQFDPNPLFDCRHYLETYCRSSSAEVNPLADYLVAGAPADRWINPFFQAETYCQLNPDISQGGVYPLLHYMHHGLGEGRRAWQTKKALQILDALSHDALATGCYDYFLRPTAVSRSPDRTIAIYTSSEGNYYFDEIKLIVVAGFRQAGWQVHDLTDKDERPLKVDFDLVIAPHEFFYLGRGPEWVKRLAYQPTTIIYNTEQLHREWFGRSYPFLRGASRILDINLQSAAVLRRLGITAHYFPLGFVPELAPLSSPVVMPRLLATAPLSPDMLEAPVLPGVVHGRPIDVFFCGSLSPRREAFFAQHAQNFAAWNCFFYLFRAGPILAGSRRSLSSEAVVGLSRRSKILLNIHQDDTPYFEWQRIVMQGIWQGALVVTEPSFEVPFLLAGEHYISCGLAEIPEKIRWLLEADEGRQAALRITTEGQAALRRHYDHLTITRRLIDNALPL